MDDVMTWKAELERLRSLWSEHNAKIAELEPSRWSTQEYENITERTQNLDEAAQAVGYACLAALLQGESLDTAVGIIEHPRLANQNKVTERVERTTPAVPPKELIHDLMDVLELPDEMTSLEDLLEELEFLEDLTHPEELQDWESLPNEIRVRLMEHLAARARGLQGHGLATPPDIDPQRIGRLFGRMADHLKQGWPGHAHGLALHHHPRSGSWRRDARDRIQDIKELAYVEFPEAQDASSGE